MFGRGEKGFHGKGGCCEEPVRLLQEARGADGVHVQVRDHVLRCPPVSGGARVQLRLQRRGPRRHRHGESGRQGGQGGEDLRVWARVFSSMLVPLVWLMVWREGGDCNLLMYVGVEMQKKKKEEKRRGTYIIHCKDYGYEDVD